MCVIGGLKAGIEESAVGKEQTHSEISIQSRWEELLKSVSEKKNDKKKDQKKSESTEAAQKNIRILLMTDGYKQIVHKELKVSATGGLIIEKTGTREETAENEKITITKEDVGFQNGKIRVTAKDGGEMVVSSIRRGYRMNSARKMSSTTIMPTRMGSEKNFLRSNCALCFLAT